MDPLTQIASDIYVSRRMKKGDVNDGVCTAARLFQNTAQLGADVALLRPYLFLKMTNYYSTNDSESL